MPESHKIESSQTLRELTRSPDGMISAMLFRRGAIFVGILTFVLGLIVLAVSALSHSMEWMTVVIAPIFGGLLFFLACSLIYFWYCLFTKRLRALKRSPLLLYSWLATLFLAGFTKLVDYQEKSLKLNDDLLAPFGSISIFFMLFSIILFFMLIGICLSAKDVSTIKLKQ